MATTDLLSFGNCATKHHIRRFLATEKSPAKRNERGMKGMNGSMAERLFGVGTGALFSVLQAMPTGQMRLQRFSKDRPNLSQLSQSASLGRLLVTASSLQCRSARVTGK